MTLGELVARLPGAVLAGDPGLLVSEVTHDSRRAGAGALFVAVRGFAADGNSFVGAARKKGAVAVCSERAPAPDTPWVQVADAREALAAFSAAALGHPALSLELVGVTGTTGKTTSTYLIGAPLL